MRYGEFLFQNEKAALARFLGFSPLCACQLYGTHYTSELRSSSGSVVTDASVRMEVTLNNNKEKHMITLQENEVLLAGPVTDTHLCHVCM